MRPMRSIRALLLRLYEDRKTIILTFEMFWIAVFLLKMLDGTSGENLAFVYANF